ncbi:DUF4093 domain-containing protein [Dehalobacter sp. DCM]|uniref:toprim domain-containing protein n=1 Tax=Dehalobacter sp. DCM TaxID=2907827 RepID=UPI0030818A38|nr:DUF4093 domain-containing protein [Dehalobacter sp. DCM]
MENQDNEFVVKDRTELDFKPLIVVEGKNDAHAVRRALGKVDVLWTEGFGLTEEKLAYIAEMAERCGVVVCTDPDFPGTQIRDRINRRVPKVKHVYLSKAIARNEKNNDIGLENVSPEEIRKAFAKVLEDQQKSPFVPDANPPGTVPDGLIAMADLLELDLAGQAGSSQKRALLGKILGIGDTNAKQFIFRANRFRITKADLYKAAEQLEKG